MVSEPRKQSMAWMETDYSKGYVFSMEGKMAALGAMGETARLIDNA